MSTVSRSLRLAVVDKCHSTTFRICSYPSRLCDRASVTWRWNVLRFRRFRKKQEVPGNGNWGSSGWNGLGVTGHRKSANETVSLSLHWVREGSGGSPTWAVGRWSFFSSSAFVRWIQLCFGRFTHVWSVGVDCPPCWPCPFSPSLGQQPLVSRYYYPFSVVSRIYRNMRSSIWRRIGTLP